MTGSLVRTALRGVGTVLVFSATAGLLLAAATASAAWSPTVARVWLLLFAVLGAAPVGALVLLMVAALTGGRWGGAWRPVLAPLALACPVVALAFLPIAVSLPVLYPWAADPGAAPANVARYYLNAPAVLVRAAVALGGWAVLGLLFGLGRPSRLAAGLGLAFHGLAISLVAVDWFMSLEPGYTSSNFAALVAIQQIATALALVALFGRDEPAARGRGDLGGLLITTQVGIAYLGLMAFIIVWYGDLPETIVWYLRRSQVGWLALVVAAVVAGCLVPFAILLRRDWRRGGPMLRLAGASALAGLALHDLWLIGPPLGDRATAWAALALALGVALGFGWTRLRRPRGEVAHVGS